jgi:hypothetical protein
VRINVKPVFDSPVLFVPGQIYDSKRMSSDLLSSLVIDTNVIYVDEDSGMYVIEGSSVRCIDAVARDGFLKLIISAKFGKLTMVGLIEYSMSSGSGRVDGIEGLILDVYDDNKISLRAPYSIINHALNKIGFTPLKNYNGPSAGLTITVAQSDHNDMTSELSDSRYIRIYVNQINDAPLISVGDDPNTTSIVTISEGDILQLNRVRNLNVNSFMVGSGYDSRASSGFELWKFEENLGSATKAQDSTSHILGSLEWQSGQIADIHPGDMSSNPRSVF